MPIKQKLIFIILATCISMLLLACIALATFELFDYRRAMARDMTVLAEILAQNTKAALVFQDESEAREKLMTFQAEPHVMAAGLYTSDDARFSEYIRTDANVVLPSQPGADGYRFENNSLILFRPIVLNEKRIGTIYLQADLQGIYGRLRLFGGIAVLILLGTSLIAFVLSSRLQRLISRPILALSETARTITEHNDYSQRAQKISADEVGQLTDSFNEMLEQIQQRDSALRTSEAHLRTVVENLAEGVAVSDLDGNLLHFNRAALDMHRFTSREEYLIPLNEFADTFELSALDGTVWPVDLWPLARVLRGEILRDLEVRIRSIKTGWERVFSYGGTLARDANGRPLMAIVTISDITERKRIEESIRQSTEELRAANEELVRFNRVMVDRELRMVELKAEINEYCTQLGLPPRYSVDYSREHQ